MHLGFERAYIAVARLGMVLQRVRPLDEVYSLSMGLGIVSVRLCDAPQLSRTTPSVVRPRTRLR